MNLEFSVGRFHVHMCFGSGVDENESEVVELKSETRLVGFQPREDWDDEGLMGGIDA